MAHMKCVLLVAKGIQLPDSYLQAYLGSERALEIYL